MRIDFQADLRPRFTAGREKLLSAIQEDLPIDIRATAAISTISQFQIASI
jgi:hypothetical protein